MRKIFPLAIALAVAAGAAQAQDAAATAAAAAPPAVSADVAYIFNTLLFLIGGFLVMWMAAGFAMLEAGLVRSKNVTTQLFKNISLFAIAGLMFWVVGYNLMYPGDAWTVPNVIGQLFSPKSIDPVGAGNVCPVTVSHRVTPSCDSAICDLCFRWPAPKNAAALRVRVS